MSARKLVGAFVLALASALSHAPAAAAQHTVKLSVDPGTAITARLLSFGEDELPASVTGDVTAQVVLADDPSYGIIVGELSIPSGELAIGPIVWSVSNALESIDAELVDALAQVTASPVDAIGVGSRTSVIPTDDLLIVMNAGSLAASGPVLDGTLTIDRLFDVNPRSIKLGPQATLVTGSQPSGETYVELRIPIDEAVPLAPPYLVSWITIQGELVLSGSAVAAVPVSPGVPPIVVGLIAAAGVLMLHRVGRARRRMV